MNEIMTTVFGLAGGLAMFLFGMNSMSDALQKAAGERMKQILSFLTKNPIMGALAGALVTAVLQSSSATTVMVIGFVSAGLMTLPQGISVIFGANIGTTMTAQLMAFKISDYIYPIIFIGFLVYFIAKSEKAKNIGMVIFSFGLLFEGIEIMGSVMKPLAGSAVFTDLMGRVSEIPALGVLLGAVMTLVVQSSSATIAVLQNFASQPAADGVTSVIGLAGAIPIGDNIGTTITALLASIGQSKAAKRTAISHSIFNITGSIVFACLIRPFAAFVTYISPHGNEVDVIARQIANAHTCFNIVCTLIWLPLLPVMVKLVTTIIPGKDKLPQTDCKPKFLDEKLLDQPVAAMYLLSQEIGHCADMASDMLNTAKAALHGKAEDFHTYEVESNQVRNLRNDISDYTAKLLSSGVLTESQSEQTAGLLYVSNNIDRMTEYSQRVTQTVQQVYQSGRKLSASAEQELNECYDTAHDLFDRAVDSVRYGDADMAQQVLADKKKLRKAQKRFNKAHMARVKAGKCESNLTADFSAILYGLERMVDNSVNIAEETLDSIHFVELEPAQMEALSDRGIPVPVPAQ